MSANFKTGNGSQGYDGTFNAIGIAYNPLARFFEGAKPAGKIRYPNGVICYIYTRDRREIAAIWNYGSRRDLSADFSGFAVMDMFGNPASVRRAPPHRSAVLPPRERRSKEFRRYAEKTQHQNGTESHRQPGRASRRRQKRQHGSVRPRSTTRGTARSKAKPDSADVSRRRDGIQDFRIEANKAAVLRFPREGKGRQSEKHPASLCRWKARPVPARNDRRPAAEAGTELSVSHGDSTPFTFKIERTEKEDPRHGRRQDSTDSGAPGGRPVWEQDCVELFFDRAPFTSALEHPEKHTKNVFRLFVLPRQKKIHYMNHDGKISIIDLPLEIKTEKERYSLALSIPETQLPLNSGAIGFEIKIDDAEPSGKNSRESCWANGPAPSATVSYSESSTSNKQKEQTQ